MKPPDGSLWIVLHNFTVPAWDSYECRVISSWLPAGTAFTVLSTRMYEFRSDFGNSKYMMIRVLTNAGVIVWLKNGNFQLAQLKRLA